MNPSSNATDERLTDVEIRIAFLERTLTELDDVVRGLADQMDRIRREIQELRTELSADRVTFSASAADDVPPHY